MGDSEPTVHRVVMWLCELCLDGKGGECHVGGCALFLCRAPDLSRRHYPLVESVDGFELCDACHDKRASVLLGPEQYCETCGTEAKKHV